VDPLGGARAEDPGSAHHQRYETSTVGPLRGAGAGDPRVPAMNVKIIDGGPPDPCRGGPVLIQDPRDVL
jgi:hypothetical protein